MTLFIKWVAGLWFGTGGWAHWYRRHCFYALAGQQTLRALKEAAEWAACGISAGFLLVKSAHEILQLLAGVTADGAPCGFCRPPDQAWH